MEEIPLIQPDREPSILIELLFSGTSFNVLVLLFSILLGLLVLLLTRWQSQNTNIPTINSYSWDLSRRRALSEYTDNARELILSGLEKVN